MAQITSYYSFRIFQTSPISNVYYQNMELLLKVIKTTTIIIAFLSHSDRQQILLPYQLGYITCYRFTQGRKTDPMTEMLYHFWIYLINQVKRWT